MMPLRRACVRGVLLPILTVTTVVALAGCQGRPPGAPFPTASAPSTSNDESVSTPTVVPTTDTPKDGISLVGSKSVTDAEGYTWQVDYDLEGSLSDFTSDSTKDKPGQTTITLAFPHTLLTLTNTTAGHNLNQLGSDGWAVFGQYKKSSRACHLGSAKPYHNSCLVPIAGTNLFGNFIDVSTPYLTPNQTIGSPTALSINGLISVSGVNESDVSTYEQAIINPQNVMLVLSNGSGTLRGPDDRLTKLCTLDATDLQGNAVVIASVHPTSCE